MRFQTSHALACAMHLLSALVLLAIPKDWPHNGVPVTAAYAKWVPQPDGTRAVETVQHTVARVSIKATCVAYFLVTAAFHAHALLRADHHRRLVLSRNNVWRWVEYAVTAPLQVVTIALLTGIADLFHLLALACLTACTMAGGFFQDLVVLLHGAAAKPHASARTLRWIPFALGCVPFAVVWGTLAAHFHLAIANTPGAPAVLHAIVWTEFVLFAAFAPVQLLSHAHAIAPSTADRAFTALSFVAKSALAWLIVAGLWSRDDTLTV